MRYFLQLIILLFLFLGFACEFSTSDAQTMPIAEGIQSSPIVVGAERIGLYHNLLKNKNVAIVVNQASRVGREQLLDTLIALDINVKKIFVPEHGFRGNADAGEHIEDEIDAKTGIPIISLYGKNRKPISLDFDDIDYVVYDLQDVGVRFYTYISTLFYIMQSCAELDIPLVILDRPNPNGFYVDGPVLNMKYKSFVGMLPIPVVYGLTIGESGLMMNGERWLGKGLICDLKVIKCLNYNHKMTYDLPIQPSPNLPNLRSILLYPSLCFFEPTIISIGRGTENQFQLYGHPNWPDKSFMFKPISRLGAKHPKHENKKCYGIDLSDVGKYDLLNDNQINLSYLLNAYKTMNVEGFFTSPAFFNKLAGNSILIQQIKDGLSEKEIRQSWEPKLSQFKMLRKKYLLYKDFNPT